ncbi:MAG: hypothetical protein GY941_30280 [Planctomycetes bacterium]|nr:hypothetical protein [Planctomycetota bacterium]
MNKQKKLQEALVGTIQHWQEVKANKDGQVAWKVGSINCKLCKVCDSYCGYDGEKCPIYAKTGKPSCGRTPYSDYEKCLKQILSIKQTYHWWIKPFALAWQEHKRKKFAQEMINLLVSCQPKEEGPKT